MELIEIIKQLHYGYHVEEKDVEKALSDLEALKKQLDDRLYIYKKNK